MGINTGLPPAFFAVYPSITTTMSGFNDLLKKGELALGGGKDGKGPDLSNIQKDAQQAYDTFNKTEGSATDKAKAAYSEFSSKSGDSKESSEKKE